LTALTFRKVDERAAVARELVICRSDLPRNPKWSEEGLPHASCWIVPRLFEEAERAGPASDLYREARRVWWEAYWRRLGRYRGGRPFFEVYELSDRTVRPYRDREEFVLNNIVLEGLRLVPPEVREYTVKLYKELFGRS